MAKVLSKIYILCLFASAIRQYRYSVRTQRSCIMAYNSVARCRVEMRELFKLYITNTRALYGKRNREDYNIIWELIFIIMFKT